MEQHKWGRVQKNLNMICKVSSRLVVVFNAELTGLLVRFVVSRMGITKAWNQLSGDVR